MQILSVASFFFMQEMLNRIIFKVFNQTQKILFLEIVKKSIQAVSIVLGIIKLDLAFLLYGFAITSLISYFINFYYSRKVIGSAAFYEIFVLLKVVLVSVASVLITILLAGKLHLSGLVVLHCFRLLYYRMFY
jgi:hypothetical protein